MFSSSARRAAHRPGPDALAAARPLALSDGEFGRLQALIHREAGIYLAPVKRALLVGRLSRRVQELGLPGFGAYCDRAAADPGELTRMLDLVSTNETHFFREPRHFEYLAEEVLPRWREEAAAGRRPRRVHVWSAACSTGEEPYSLAMTLLQAFPPGSGWELGITATDLSTRVLERARAAEWPLAKAAEIPGDRLRAFMLRGTGPQEGLMKAGPELRALVRFARLNLAGPTYGVPAGFDLLFCRNVLIYFDQATKAQVVGRLLRHLAPGGLLFLGHAESLAGTDLPVRSLLPTVYAHAAAGAEAP